MPKENQLADEPVTKGEFYQVVLEIIAEFTNSHRFTSERSFTNRALHSLILDEILLKQILIITAENLRYKRHRYLVVADDRYRLYLVS